MSPVRPFQIDIPQAQLDDLRRIYMHPDLELPYGLGNTSVSVTKFDYLMKHGGTEENGYIDEEGTKQAMSKGMKALKSLGAKIEKKYTEGSFTIEATFDSGLVFKISTNRAVICAKKVIDRVWIEPSQGYFREVVEWECEPVSLLDV